MLFPKKIGMKYNSYLLFVECLHKFIHLLYTSTFYESYTFRMSFVNSEKDQIVGTSAKEG